MLPASRVVEGATWLTHWKPPETMTMDPPEGDCKLSSLSGSLLGND